MGSWFWTVPLSSALLLAGCAAHAGLPSYAAVPDFTLTDQSGARFSSASALRGQVWVADFIFTTCSGPCPRMSSQMHQVQTALSGSDGFRLVSFTVDPAHDTPEVLAAYGRNFKAQPGRWFFLTGSQPALQHLCRDVFLLGNVDATLEHSTRFVLIDRASRVRGFYDTSEQDAVPRLIADAKSLLRERSSVTAPQRKAVAAFSPNWGGGHGLLWRSSVNTAHNAAGREGLLLYASASRAVRSSVNTAHNAAGREGLLLYASASRAVRSSVNTAHNAAGREGLLLYASASRAVRSSVNTAHNAAGREGLLLYASASRAVRSSIAAPQRKVVAAVSPDWRGGHGLLWRP